MIVKTPLYDLKNYPNVYDPQEDTFLFLDAIEKEADFLISRKPSLALEVGSGSGIVISAIQKILGNTSNCFATDVNLEACLATRHTSKLNGTPNVEVSHMNLGFNFRPKLFDLVLFNPPYVVTEVEETCGTGLNRAWAGGFCGRQIIDVFLQELPNILNDNGLCYMVALKENKPEEIMGMMSSKFNSWIVQERKIRGEHLFVLKLLAKS